MIHPAGATADDLSLADERLSHRTASCACLHGPVDPPGDLPTEGVVILAARSVEDRGVRFDRPAPERMEKGVVLPSVPAATIRNDSLVGTLGGRSYALPVNRVKELTIEEARTSTARTALMLGGIGLILLVATAPFLCPLC